jgi:hypothetical protein
MTYENYNSWSVESNGEDLKIIVIEKVMTIVVLKSQQLMCRFEFYLCLNS